MMQHLKTLTLLVATVCITQFAFAQSSTDRLEITFQTGFQQQNLNWSISGNSNGQNPNVFSELKWRHVGGITYGAALSFKIIKNIYLTGSYNLAEHTSGTVNDMDYGADNRTSPTYTGNFSSDKNRSYSWYGGLAYQLFENRVANLRAGAGYGIDHQYMAIIDHSGQFPGLNSSYVPEWKGPYINALAVFNLTSKWKLLADATYHQVSYTAVGNWNLISQFQHPVSYTHSANGFGVTLNAKLAFAITKQISLCIGGGFLDWETGNGNDLLYLNTGEVDRTRLNSVYSTGFKLLGGVEIAL